MCCIICMTQYLFVKGWKSIKYWITREVGGWVEGGDLLLGSKTILQKNENWENLTGFSKPLKPI